jgi:hypothetical protein
MNKSIIELSEESKFVIRVLIRGLKFTVSLLEKVLKGEKV